MAEIEKIEGYHFWKDYSEPDMVVSSRELWEHLKDQKVKGFRIPQFPQIDNLMEGFEEGELIVVSGLTKHGKTCLCQSLTRAIIENGQKPLWFTFEVTSRRFLIFMSEEGKDVPLFYMPQQLKHKDLNWLKNRIIESIVKYGVDTIFIDHLHELLNFHARNLSISIGEVMSFLKDIALEYRVVIFLITHMQKVNTDEEPTAQNIRDSSLIPAESDAVWIILRMKEKNNAKLKIEFTRRSGVFNEKINLKKKKYFEEEIEGGKVENENKWWNNKNINLLYKNGGDEE